MQNGGLSEMLAVPPVGLLYDVMYYPNANPYVVNALALNRVFMVFRQLKRRSKVRKPVKSALAV